MRIGTLCSHIQRMHRSVKPQKGKQNSGSARNELLEKILADIPVASCNKRNYKGAKNVEELLID